ncbi:FMN-binding protein [Nocardioides guangzhouensis]|uniref:FMN-binding protein n=1 Tax=Nocardioides guangzhouensis TaxID=2497878 RepID=A0A4Q4ZEL7_9ACTN|nr:FMN-binding protein [Nocardioides guangzhouensis]RYP86507.1 FMN-binding protein [Nocardioides guangzhouensis]
MRRIVLWAMSTLTALVLLFSYQTSHGTSQSTATSSAIQHLNDSSQTTGGSSSGTSGTSGSTAGGTTATYTGDSQMTPYGPVQVQITVKGGQITRSEVLQVPWSGGHDQMINSHAVPILNQETVQAQSSSIDMVSGATYTSQGYIGSLQSAIDQAQL